MSTLKRKKKLPAAIGRAVQALFDASRVIEDDPWDRAIELIDKYESKVVSAYAEILQRAENRHGRGWILGNVGGNLLDGARVWAKTGLKPDLAGDYIEAGAFDPAGAKELYKAGLKSWEAAEVLPGWDHSIAYAVSNGDITAKEASRKLR